MIIVNDRIKNSNKEFITHYKKIMLNVMFIWSMLYIFLYASNAYVEYLRTAEPSEINRKLIALAKTTRVPSVAIPITEEVYPR